MTEDKNRGNRFGDIAIYKNFVSAEVLDKALKVQKLVYKKSRTYAPIGKILIRMGVMTKRQVEEVIAIQKRAKKDIPLPHHERGDISPHLSSTATAKERKPTGSIANEDFRIKVAENRLFASLFLKEGKTPSLDNILLQLKKMGIKYGIVEKKVIDNYLSTSPTPKKPLLIAKGKPPMPGRREEIKYYFELDPLCIGTVKEDGTIDWKERGKLPVVKKGTLLAEKIRGTEGKPGIDVFGEEVFPPASDPVILRCGSGAELSPDGSKVFAACDGMPKLVSDGLIAVFPNIIVNGDVCIETGHIDFNGHVEISGIVQKGYRVKGKSIRAMGLEGAHVEALEDAVFMAGVYDSDVKASGDVKAGHIHESKIDSLGDLIVQKEIIGSRIEVNGKCDIRDGRIISSEIMAKKGVIVDDIGSEGTKPSVITVGIDFKLRREINELHDEIEHKKEFIKTTAENLEELNEKLDDLETELGELALEQDKYMVRERTLREKMSKSTGLPEKTREILEKELNQLREKISLLDDKVSQILSEEEETEKQISDMKDEMENRSTEIDDLRKKIDVLMDYSEADRGKPVIKIYGEVQPKTRIITPHCKYVVKEPLRRVTISETKGNKYGKARISIGPLN